MTSSSTSHSEFMNGSVSSFLSGITLPHSGTAATHEHIRWKVRRRRGSGSEAGKRGGTRAPLPSLFKEEALQLRKDERLGRKTLSLPLLNADMKSTLTESRGDAPGLMGRTPVKQDVTWVGPTTTACRTQQLKRAHVGNPLLPQAGQRNDPTTEPFPRGAQRAARAERTA